MSDVVLEINPDWGIGYNLENKELIALITLDDWKNEYVFMKLKKSETDNWYVSEKSAFSDDYEIAEMEAYCVNRLFELSKTFRFNLTSVKYYR